MFQTLLPPNVRQSLDLCLDRMLRVPSRTPLLAFICLAFASSGQGQLAGKPLTPSDTGASEQPNGASRCAFCHPSEVKGYALSAMAHSLRRASQEADGTVEAHGSTITMHSSRDGFRQRWENGSEQREYHVDYVVGSGNHATGYFVEIGGHLFQSPVAYYQNRQTYGLAPGYENQPDPDFTRPVSEECVLCHSGTSLHVPGTLNEYRSPVFPAEGITCERCHGPVEKHLSDPRRGTIVAPAKLEPAARDSVCEQCHLFGAARVPNPGKKLSDFVPGQPLEDTFTVYRNTVPAGSAAGAFKVISHVEQLALSACARNSGGRLWCGTCHNPHAKPAEPVQFYRLKCLSCHTSSFPASHPAKDSNCLSCHMPTRNAKDGGHTAFTDHRIQRRPEVAPEVQAETSISAWREPSPALQKRNMGIAKIDVGMQHHSSSMVIQGYRDLTEVQQQFGNDPEFFKWIGEALLLGKKTSDATFAFERALQLDPHSALTEASAAAPYIQAGEAAKAIAHLERAVALDPLNLPNSTTLIRLYQQEGQLAGAAALSAKIKVAMAGTTEEGKSSRETSATGTGRSAQEIFKNIQVLNSIPSSQLIPAMQFISSSLGVGCSFCHIAGHFERDDKKNKKTARTMIQMMIALNKNNFEGQRQVTCYSCHHGTASPEATPAVDRAGQPTTPHNDHETQTTGPKMPTAEMLIQKYIEALGGAEALEKITSRVESGITRIQGQPVRVEFLTEYPKKQALVYHLNSGDDTATFDGHAGWVAVRGSPPREMHESELELARINSDLQFPLHIRQMFPELHVEYPEKIDDRPVNVLFGICAGRSSVKLYFDEESNLLVRLVQYTDSPLGINAAQIDYADYRLVEGVQIPFRIVRSQPGNRSEVQWETVRQNIQIDESGFARPVRSH